MAPPLRRRSTDWVWSDDIDPEVVTETLPPTCRGCEVGLGGGDLGGNEIGNGLIPHFTLPIASTEVLSAAHGETCLAENPSTESKAVGGYLSLTVVRRLRKRPIAEKRRHVLTRARLQVRACSLHFGKEPYLGNEQSKSEASRTLGGLAALRDPANTADKPPVPAYRTSERSSRHRKRWPWQRFSREAAL